MSDSGGGRWRWYGMLRGGFEDFSFLVDDRSMPMVYDQVGGFKMVDIDTRLCQLFYPPYSQSAPGYMIGY